MSRLPVRVRLTLAFVLAMAVVLVAIGALLYVRLGDALSEQLDESLQLRAQALASGGGLGTGDDEAVGPEARSGRLADGLVARARRCARDPRGGGARAGRLLLPHA